MANRLRIVRLIAGISQEELAKAVGVSRQTIHNIEHGKGDTKGSLLLKIARYFNLPVEEIFCDFPVTQELQTHKEPTRTTQAG